MREDHCLRRFHFTLLVTDTCIGADRRLKAKGIRLSLAHLDRLFGNMIHQDYSSTRR